MAQERSEGFGTGLFPSNRNPAASFANRQRKSVERDLRCAKRDEAIGARQRGKKRGPYKVRSPKLDLFAELLSQDLSFADIAARMNATPKAVERHMAALRKRMGPQAV